MKVTGRSRVVVLITWKKRTRTETEGRKERGPCGSADACGEHLWDHEERQYRCHNVTEAVGNVEI